MPAPGEGTMSHTSVLPETGESRVHAHCWGEVKGVSARVIAHEHQAGLGAEEAWEPGIRSATSLGQTLERSRGLTVVYWRNQEVPTTGEPLGCKGQILVGYKSAPATRKTHLHECVCA